MKNFGLYNFSEIKHGLKMMYGEFSGSRESDKYSLKIIYEDKETPFWQVRCNSNILWGIISVTCFELIKKNTLEVHKKTNAVVNRHSKKIRSPFCGSI